MKSGLSIWNMSYKNVVFTANTGRLGGAFRTSIEDFATGLDLGRKVLSPLVDVLGAAAVGRTELELAPPAIRVIWLDNMWGEVCACSNGADG